MLTKESVAHKITESMNSLENEELSHLSELIANNTSIKELILGSFILSLFLGLLIKKFDFLSKKFLKPIHVIHLQHLPTWKRWWLQSPKIPAWQNSIYVCEKIALYSWIFFWKIILYFLEYFQPIAMWIMMEQTLYFRLLRTTKNFRNSSWVWKQFFFWNYFFFLWNNNSISTRKFEYWTKFCSNDERNAWQQQNFGKIWHWFHFFEKLFCQQRKQFSQKEILFLWKNWKQLILPLIFKKSSSWAIPLQIWHWKNWI